VRTLHGHADGWPVAVSGSDEHTQTDRRIAHSQDRGHLDFAVCRLASWSGGYFREQNHQIDCARHHLSACLTQKRSSASVLCATAACWQRALRACVQAGRRHRSLHEEPRSTQEHKW
jgi:hypothetical protein